MNFVDGLVSSVGNFFERKVTLSADESIYKIIIKQWGGVEVANLNAESIQHLTNVVNNSDYLQNGVVLKIQQEYGMQALTIPGWAVRQLQYDLVHGNIQLPYIEC